MIAVLKKSAIIVFLTLICGCTATKPKPVVYECPRLQLPPNPTPYVLQLNAKSTPNEVVQAWAATALAYYNWNLAVNQQVEFSK